MLATPIQIRSGDTSTKVCNPDTTGSVENPDVDNPIQNKTSIRVQQYDLILVGKTGNGKSSTGNTILGGPVFGVSDSDVSVTKTVAFASSDKPKDGIKINVIDTPGLFDTCLSKEIWIQECVFNFINCLTKFPSGFHALIIVLKYNAKFTQEEQDTVRFLKLIFGKTFFKQHCILVFTNGEDFDQKAQHSGQTFKNWCYDQQGSLRDLLRECRYRAVLFHNLSPEKNSNNINELMDFVKSMGKFCVSEIQTKLEKITDSDNSMKTFVNNFLNDKPDRRIVRLLSIAIFLIIIFLLLLLFLLYVTE